MNTKQSKPSVIITTYAREPRSGREANHKDKERQEDNGEKNDPIHEELTTRSQIIKTTGEAGTAPTSRCKSKIRCLNQIKGPSGSVRGHRDVVRKSLENIKSASLSSSFQFQLSHNNASAPSLNSRCRQRSPPTATNTHNMTSLQLDELHRREYLKRLIDEEQGQCVAYVTTLGVIRRTFEDSKLMKTILNLNLIKYQERDIYLNQEYKRQLMMRCESPVTIPLLFVDGQVFGGIKELEYANESGKFPLLLGNFKMAKAPSQVCHCCGNAKFIACQTCNGSRKSTIHHFKFNSVALRCIKCDKNGGLVQCPICSSDNSFGLPAEENDLNNNDDNDQHAPVHR